MTASDAGWVWSAELTAFLTGNFQQRRFRDFNQAESQNWLMGAAARPIGGGRLALHGMLSFELFTLRALGSSQAFQTGETFGGAPLIDYQHPHDLVMALAAAWSRPAGPATLSIGGGLVDAPALGPTPFMHRASAALHPTAPLAHHQLDSTHIAHGVVTGAVRSAAWMAEASAFRGREPDEDRLDLDLGALDSYAVRGSWRRGGTRAQISAGWLHEPHVSEPGDLTRITASVEHAGSVRGRQAALTVAWGQNRQARATEEALLVEAALAAWRGGTVYVRGELVDKHIIGAGGLHPPDLAHAHELSRVAALLTGVSHQVWSDGRQSFAVGADITGHAVPAELRDAYGRPISIHLFGRWNLRREPPP